MNAVMIFPADDKCCSNPVYKHVVLNQTTNSRYLGNELCMLEQEQIWDFINKAVFQT